MANLLYDFLGDPRNSDIVTGTPHIQSASTGGLYSDIIAPATPNFPAVTPTRYFMRLPVVPDTTQTMVIEDITTSTVLTKVAGAPGTNQYFIAPSTSKSPDIIELNSGQAGHQISFDFYGIGSILHADDVNQQFTQLASEGTTITLSTNILPSLDVWNLSGVFIKNVAGTETGASLIINGDTTASNYHSTSMYNNGSGSFSQLSIPTRFTISSSSTNTFYNTTIQYYNGFVHMYSEHVGDTWSVLIDTIYNIPITSITSIALIANANNFGVGSFAKLKKR